MKRLSLFLASSEMLVMTIMETVDMIIDHGFVQVNELVQTTTNLGTNLFFFERRKVIFKYKDKLVVHTNCIYRYTTK